MTAMAVEVTGTNLCPHCKVGEANNRWVGVGKEKTPTTAALGVASFSVAALFVGLVCLALTPLVLVTFFAAVLFIPLGLLGIAVAAVLGVVAIGGWQIVRCSACERFSWGRTIRPPVPEQDPVLGQAVRDLVLPRRKETDHASEMKRSGQWARRRASAARITWRALKWTLILGTLPFSLVVLGVLWVVRRHKARAAAA